MRRLIKVKVVSDARKESVVVRSPDSYTVSVRAPAEAGQANRRVLHLLRQYFGSGTLMRIVSGHHKPGKIVSLEAGERRI